jgi:hypothetical protein
MIRRKSRRCPLTFHHVPPGEALPVLLPLFRLSLCLWFTITVSQLHFRRCYGCLVVASLVLPAFRGGLVLPVLWPTGDSGGTDEDETGDSFGVSYSVGRSEVASEGMTDEDEPVETGLLAP